MGADFKNLNLMQRKKFLKYLAATPLTIAAMKLSKLKNRSDQFERSEKMPVLFIGHGHPMNALFDNDFTRSLQKIKSQIEEPNAVMVVSAHWETRGTYVSVAEQPKTIHDFGRFDSRLFDIQYPAPGHPDLAEETVRLGQHFHIQTDHAMGLDHGAWTILKYIYPKADIPVFQLSIDFTKPPEYHFALAQELKELRHKGVLIIGSGNIVHNLRILDWQNINANPFDWAIEFDELAKAKLSSGDFQSLVNYKQFGKLAQLAIPSNDHYLPMLYSLGLAEKNEKVDYLFEGLQYGSISMRCFKIS